MCDQDQSPVKRFFSMIGGGTAASAAKASPGVAVTGLSLWGVSIETWVSILTAMYLIFMAVGALPKVIESVMYIVALARGERQKVKEMSSWRSKDE